MDEFNETLMKHGKQATVQLPHESLTSREIDKAWSVDENKNAARDKRLLQIIVAPFYLVPDTNCLAIYSNKFMARESGPFAIQADIKQVTCAVIARINHRMHKVDAQLLRLASHHH